MTPVVLRSISKQGWMLTNCCWYDEKDGVPMVALLFVKPTALITKEL